jgi:hypothetical protein
MADRHRLIRSTHWVLSQETRLYLAMPTGSQFSAPVHTQLMTRFGRYYHNLQEGTEQETLAAAFISARQAGLDVVVYPVITRRQQKQGASEVVRRKARIRDIQPGLFDMDLGLYTVGEKQKVDQFQFQSRAGALTAHEEDVFWKPLDAYLRLLSEY